MTAAIGGIFMHRLLGRLFLGALLSGPSFGAFAEWNEPHVEGMRPHAIIKPYPQARVHEFDEKDFDSTELVTGHVPGDDPEVKVEEIEGRVLRYSYEHKPGTSPLEILRQYENALQKAGFVKILAGRVSKLPESSAISGDVFGAFRLDRDGKPAIYVNLRASDHGWVESHLLIVEPGAMEQKLSADAEGFYRSILETGRVAVHGINFDTAKATIRPDSEPVLHEIETLLSDHSELRLKIEGHTDNVGQPAANQKLSQARAEAVKGWLVKRGIKADRVVATGFGDPRPIGDNSSEEGRASNRRVELAR
jgi:outer membrane protein OmpA-like peptidoglycan-associated protein